MKQTIEIEVPNGKKAVLKNTTIVFEDIEHQLPKTWEEFCKQNPLNKKEAYIVLNSDIHQVTMSISERDFKADRNVLSSKEVAEQHLALMQLHQLRDCYRQGWKPDWNENRTAKYSIEYYDAKDYGVFTSHTMPAFLSFQSMEIAKEFLDNFRDLIKQAGDLI